MSRLCCSGRRACSPAGDQTLDEYTGDFEFLLSEGFEPFRRRQAACHRAAIEREPNRINSIEKSKRNGEGRACSSLLKSAKLLAEIPTCSAT